MPPSIYLQAPSSAGLILASSSPRRAQILRAMGIHCDIQIAANIDETPHPGERPAQYAKRMAIQKAWALYRHPDLQNKSAQNFIIAGDTVVSCGVRILPKAETRAQAQFCLDLLSGRRHRVYGGVCLIAPDGRCMSRVSLSHVAFRALCDADKRAYIQTGEWRGKAGGYAIQGMASLYIRQIIGSYSNIVGFDSFRVANLLLGAGFHYPRADKTPPTASAGQAGQTASAGPAGPTGPSPPPAPPTSFSSGG